MKNDTRQCKLCITAEADKTNSHIVPKWMAKTMLNTGKGYKGFSLNTSTTHLPRKPSQDIPKEDYILCTSCEQYFSVIETWYKNAIHNQLHGTPRNKNYEEQINQKGAKWAEFTDPNMMRLARLFYYSILWRTHITSAELWNNIKLPSREEEYLRKILLECRVNTKTDLTDKLQLVDSNNSPWFLVITCLDIKNKTRNLMGESPTPPSIYKFFLNDQELTISFPPNEYQSLFDPFNNTSTDRLLKIAVVPLDYWNNQISEHINLLRENSIEQLNKSGNQYYSNKKR